MALASDIPRAVPTTMPPLPPTTLGRPDAAGGASPAPHTPSYRAILKSSLVIGTSGAVTMAVGLVRTKVLALLLGPAGMGLMTMYSATADLAQAVAGLGVNSSGVRQIAESAASQDERRIARTAAALRRTSMLLGLVAAILLALGSTWIADVTFGSKDYAAAVAVLGLVAWCGVMAGAQTALLQGLRRIADLAKAAIVTSCVAAVASIASVYWLGENGILVALAGSAVAAWAVPWWYARRYRTARVDMSAIAFGLEASSLLKLGVAFMASGLVMMGSAYAVRAILLRVSGLEAAGLYQCAWTLAGLYASFILQAMGADFYPRLVGAASNDDMCNRLVNEQARVGMLLVTPGMLATIVFAPMLVALLYSDRFAGAVETLRWIGLGMMLRVWSWPLGFIIIAKARRRLLLVAEVAWGVAAVAFAWPLAVAFGAEGAGAAFCASYLFHLVMVYGIARAISGFRWTAQNFRTTLFLFALIATAFVGFRVLPQGAALACGGVLLGVSCLHSVARLAQLVPDAPLAARVIRLRERLRPGSRLEQAP